MKRLFVKDLSKGITVLGETFAIQDVKKGETKNGKPYYRLELIDKTGNVGAQIWSDAFDNIDQKSIKAGKVIMIDASVEEYKNKLQLNISKVTGVQESDLDEYLEASDFELDELWVMLEKHIDTIKDQEIKKLLNDIFSDKYIKDNYKTNPAAERIHHSFLGGLLEHVVEMLDMIAPIQKFYKEPDYDLVKAGIILHDIGKIFELQIESTVVQRTKEGRLIGHLIQSYEVLLKFSKGIIKEETLLKLKHIILSHHGILEYGSPVLPATIEAAIVHTVDEASTRIRVFQKVLKKNIVRDDEFTEWDPIIKTQVYKG